MASVFIWWANFGELNSRGLIRAVGRDEGMEKIKAEKPDLAILDVMT